MASARQEAANARARALGYKNAYDRRIKTALLKGKSKAEARGNHPKETKITKKHPLPTSYHIDGWQSGGKNKAKRHRVFDVPLNPAQAKEVMRLEKLGKPKTAKTYVLAVVYNVPILAGIDKYQPGMDYDTGGTLPDYGTHKKSEEADSYEYDGYDYEEYDDFDWYDVPEYDDGGYAIE